MRRRSRSWAPTSCRRSCSVTASGFQVTYAVLFLFAVVAEGIKVMPEFYVLGEGEFEELLGLGLVRQQVRCIRYTLRDVAQVVEEAVYGSLMVQCPDEVQL